MISQVNFELARPTLEHQVKERGRNFPIARENWDTYIGWKQRGRDIHYGSKGFRVELVVPYLKDKRGPKLNTGFVRRKKILFSINQTV